MSVNLIITFNVIEEHVPEFNDLMASVKRSLPEVDGCHGVRVYNDTGDPKVFVIVETWDSADVHGRHVQGLKDSGQWDGIAALLERDPVASYYHEQ